MGEPIEQRRRHLGIAEDGGPFAEAEVWPAAGFVDTEMRCLTEVES
jgi:hypothetical protein